MQMQSLILTFVKIGIGIYPVIGTMKPCKSVIKIFINILYKFGHEKTYRYLSDQVIVTNKFGLSYGKKPELDS